MTPLWFWEVDIQARLSRRAHVLQKWVRAVRGAATLAALEYPSDAVLMNLLLGEGCSLLVTLERK
jgi:hypothetical protein